MTVTKMPFTNSPKSERLYILKKYKGCQQTSLVTYPAFFKYCGRRVYFVDNPVGWYLSESELCTMFLARPDLTYGPPLSAHGPGVAPRQQRGPAGRALGVGVVAGEDHTLRGVSAIYLGSDASDTLPLLGTHRPRWTAGDSGLFQGTSAQPRSSTTMVTMCGGESWAHEARQAARRSLIITGHLGLFLVS